MNGREFWALQDISNDALEASLSRLLGAGARVEARIVAHLAEVEERRLHLLAGCSSMYDYCHKRLGLSDYEAFIRIAAARVARKYQVVFEMLERRELNLTAVCEVREFLTVANHRELLAEISGQTKLQIREILARRFPQADVPARVRRLPALEPLAPGRYQLTLTLSAEQKRKLDLARDLLSHANPKGDLALVLERALDELIVRLEKRRLGQVSRGELADRNPREGVGDPERGCDAEEGGNAKDGGDAEHRCDVGHGCDAEHGCDLEDAGIQWTNEADAVEHRQPGERPVVEARRRHIPRATRRELLARDGFRCAFVSEAGVRCDARAFLQFHHRHPWACGGSDRADNLELLCWSHNRLLAEKDFGRTHIEGAIAERVVERG
jgi:5-methylcytosine-specific restriction endonuclease McrA